MARRHDDGSAIAQDLRYAAHDLGGIVTNPDHGIGAKFVGVSQHQLEGLGPGLLAKTAEERNVAAHERLEGSADRAENGSRANGYAADDAEAPDNLVSVESECRCRKRSIHELSSVL